MSGCICYTYLENQCVSNDSVFHRNLKDKLFSQYGQVVNTKLAALSTDSKLRAERMNNINHNSAWSHTFSSLPSIACIHAGKSKIFAKFITSESEQVDICANNNFIVVIYSLFI